MHLLFEFKVRIMIYLFIIIIIIINHFNSQKSNFSPVALTLSPFNMLERENCRFCTATLIHDKVTRAVLFASLEFAQ